MNNFWTIFDPQSIIEYGGIFLLLFVVFAETGLFIGFFLPGDSLLFISGMICSTKPDLLRNLNIVWVIALLCLAAITGNVFGYWFGRRTGPALFTKDDNWIFKKRYMEITRTFYNRHGGKTLILGRFLPIIRTFAPILAGVIKIDFGLFMLYNVTGAVAWVTSIGLAGYYLGTIAWVQNNIEYIVIGLIIITFIPIITAGSRKNAEKPS